MQAARSVGFGARLHALKSAKPFALPLRGSTRSVTLKSVPAASATDVLNAQRLNRPSSPHFTIYQPQITWYGSILHRITGSALSGLLYAFSIGYLLGPVAGIPFDSAQIVELAHSLPEWAKLSAKTLLAAPFAYHSWNGVRHLTWDVVKPIKKDKKLSKVMEHNFQEVKAEIKQSVGSPDEEDDALFASPFGHLNKPQSRKTLYLLIQLLNLAFPDYDFSEVKSDHFNKESSGADMLRKLSDTLYNVRPQYGPRLVYSSRSYSTYPPTAPEFFAGSPHNSLSLSQGPSPTSSLSRLSSSPSSPVLLAAPLSSGIHPTLFQVLDKVISLNQCEVYSYVPDMESDPHADDSDSDTDSGLSTPDDEEYDLLGFDDFTSSSPPKPGFMSTKAPYGSWDDDDAIPGAGIKNGADHGRSFRRKSKGGLLWSSHWFFHNKKLKRILFITVWAKKRGGWTADEEDTFIGWEGAVGAGARAMGLHQKA
ncbi:hypothetical protein FRB99_000370 [Tulasnella sp. 403]|nr:hypothetical protein FRB99_000370 [Tulasnella sp. 403]